MILCRVVSPGARSPVGAFEDSGFSAGSPDIALYSPSTTVHKNSEEGFAVLDLKQYMPRCNTSMTDGELLNELGHLGVPSEEVGARLAAIISVLNEEVMPSINIKYRVNAEMSALARSMNNKGECFEDINKGVYGAVLARLLKGTSRELIIQEDHGDLIPGIIEFLGNRGPVVSISNNIIINGLEGGQQHKAYARLVLKGYWIEEGAVQLEEEKLFITFLDDNQVHYQKYMSQKPLKKIIDDLMKYKEVFGCFLGLLTKKGIPFDGEWLSYDKCSAAIGKIGFSDQGITTEDAFVYVYLRLFVVRLRAEGDKYDGFGKEGLGDLTVKLSSSNTTQSLSEGQKGMLKKIFGEFMGCDQRLNLNEIVAIIGNAFKLQLSDYAKILEFNQLVPFVEYFANEVVNPNCPRGVGFVISAKEVGVELYGQIVMSPQS